MCKFMSENGNAPRCPIPSAFPFRKVGQKAIIDVSILTVPKSIITRNEIAMRVSPYLNFDGRCDEAVEFYKGAAGAKVKMLMRFKDMPPSASPAGITPGTENKVMHGELSVGDSTVFVSDGRCTGRGRFEGVSLNLAAANEAEAGKLFNALAAGGQITMPLAKTFFASSFGMLIDKFGVSWMVIVQP
jgi:PhnB protein